MKSFIQHEICRLFTPAFIITVLIIYAITWRMLLPPFMHRTIFQTEQLLLFYGYIIRYAGFMVFYLFAMSHFAQLMTMTYRVQLATRISGAEFTYGIFIIYFIFFSTGMILPGYASAIIVQLVYAPDHIEWQVVYATMVSYPLFFQFALFAASLPLFINHVSEHVLLIMILIIQSFFFLADQFYFSNHQLLIESPLSSAGFKTLLITASIATVTCIGNGLKNYALYTGDIQRSGRNMLLRFLYCPGSCISAIHIKIMGFSAQKILVSISLLVSLTMVIITRLLKGQIDQLVDLFNTVILPLIFICNQEDIFSPEKKLRQKDQILVRQMAYSNIIFNRFCILFTVQILTGFAALGITSLSGQSYSSAYFIYYFLFNLIFSLTYLFIRIYIGSQGLAIFVLICVIYLQLNNLTSRIFRENPVLINYDINSLILNPDISFEISQIIFLTVTIISLIYFIYRILRTRQYAVSK